MSDILTKATRRLSQIKAAFVPNKDAADLPWDPDTTALPTRKNLPKIEGAPDGAAWVWGPEDFIGRLNLLTPMRVASASKEIRSGEIVPVNLPLDEPKHPAFHRETFRHEIKTLAPGVAYDDLYSLNTQSGTQWDGFRHFAHMASKTFYNHTKGEDITGPKANLKCSVHHWAEHGIAGRGVLLDVWSYCRANGIEYDPHTRFEMTYELLTAVGKAQGIDIRPAARGGDIQPGDMLFVRGGWCERYWAKTADERAALGARAHKPGARDPTTFAGLAQEEAVLDWLHDCYFATVAGDAPTFEAWPSRAPYQLHEYILALWGMPLGEMLDLERLAAMCKAKGRSFFFFTSSPANCPNGVSSHVNGQAIF